MIKFMLCLFIYLCTVLVPSPVSAHPHIFITPQAHFAFRGPVFDFFSVSWHFDDMSTMELIGPAAHSASSLSPSDKSAIFRMEGFPRPAKLSGYCYVEIDGAPVTLPPPAVTDLAVSQGKLVYSFTIGVYRPVNSTVKIWFADSTNFIAFSTAAGFYTTSDVKGKTPGFTLTSENFTEKINITY